MLTRADVERIIGNVFNELSIEVESRAFTSPNTRTVILKYAGAIISESQFDVADSPEYDG